jgi:hypothetical protein
MLNPRIATITLSSPTVTQFRLRYRISGLTVAEMIVSANYNNAGSYIQPLDNLNVLVPEQNQGSNMILIVNAINSSGESFATVASEEIIVIFSPQAPLLIVLS